MSAAIGRFVGWLSRRFESRKDNRVSAQAPPIATTMNKPCQKPREGFATLQSGVSAWKKASLDDTIPMGGKLLPLQVSFPWRAFVMLMLMLLLLMLTIQRLSLCRGRC